MSLIQGGQPAVLPPLESNSRKMQHTSQKAIFKYALEEYEIIMEEVMEQYRLEDLVQVVERLRAEDGCPWDQIQTHKSLRPYIKEEAYEVIDAIEKQDMDNLKEELGDVLLQVVMHSLIAEENHEFMLEEVIKGICEKMIRRHPNVFGNEEDIQNWDELKRREHKIGSPIEEMKAIPLALPACIRTQKIQKKAEKAGYLDKLELQKLSKEKVGKELFKLLNEARISGIDGEEALNEYTNKFVYNIEYKKCPKNP